MVATCFHGVGLRYLNMHGTGERHSHGIRLLQAILEEAPALQKLRLCYDVACVFGAAAQRALVPEQAEKLDPAIGRFHIYAHKLKCHINFGTLRKKGFGLMRGEEPELNWSLIAHLIPANRVSSGPRRTQNIDACALYHSIRTHLTFGKNLESRFRKALEMKEKEQTTMQEVCGMVINRRVDKQGYVHPMRIVTREYLEEQFIDQFEYYRKYKYVYPHTWHQRKRRSTTATYGLHAIAAP
jgi:hypothetical protein